MGLHQRGKAASGPGELSDGERLARPASPTGDRVTGALAFPSRTILRLGVLVGARVLVRLAALARSIGVAFGSGAPTPPRQRWRRAGRLVLPWLAIVGIATPISAGLVVLAPGTPNPAGASVTQSVVGDIYTIAGTGTQGTAGNSGQATNAQFTQPASSFVDASGNVYIADRANDRVQEVPKTAHTQWGVAMTAGDVYTIAGSASGASGNSGNGGPATSALLFGPSNVVLDGAGNLYFTDQYNNRVQFVAASNCSSSCPWGLSSTTANYIYTIAGSFSGAGGNSGNGGAATSALLSNPRNLRLDAAGNLYIADFSNNRIQFVAKTACSSSCPWGLSSTTANSIYTIAGSATGTSGSSGDGGLASSALLNNPGGLAFDSAGNLVVADATNNRIQFVAKTACSSSCPWGLSSTTANDIYTIAGSASGSSGTSGDGGPASSALLNFPVDVAIDSSGDVYLADEVNNRIQEMAAVPGSQWSQTMTPGNIYTVAGNASGMSGFSGDGAPATSALLTLPAGVTVDTAGDVFATDMGTNRVREITANAAPTAILGPNNIDTVAGITYPGTAGDKRQATEAQLFNPLSSVVDAAGNVYVADQSNNRVQEIAGTSHSQWGVAMTAGDAYTIAGSASSTSVAAVGSFVNNNAIGLTTLSVSPQAVGDALVLAVKISSSSIVVSSVSGGGSTWIRLNSTADSAQARDVELWLGTVNATGASTITVSFSGSVSAINTEFDAQEFSSGSGSTTLWSTDAVGASQNDTSSTSVVFPTLTPGDAGELYVGFGRAANSASAGTTSGFTYDISTNGNPYIFNPSVSSAVSPTANQSPAGQSVTVGALIQATGPRGSSGNGGAATSALLNQPSAVAVDSSGNLYVVDQFNNRVQFVAASTCSSSCPWGLASTTANAVYTIAGSATGASGTSGNGGAATSALLYLPRAIAFDASGNLYIADENNNRVQFVAKGSCSSSCPWGLASTTANAVYTIAGSASGASGSSGDGGLATSALLSKPRGIALDGSGNLYVADALNNRVQEVATATGTQWGVSMTANDIYTMAGSASGTSGSSGDGGAATAALLNTPRGISVDSMGDLYIADGNNNRIQEVAAVSGSQWAQSMTVDDVYTVAGSASGTSGYSGDGGPATSALLNTPVAVNVDAAGDLFIADMSNSRIREVVPATAAPSLPQETSGGGNPSEHNGSQPHLGISKSPDQGLSVNAITGELSDTVTDLSVPGPGMPLALNRTYLASAPGTLGPFGYGWSHTYNMSIAAGTGLLANTEQVTQENGAIAYFYANEQGGWTAPGRAQAALVHNGGGTWTFTRGKKQTFTFASSGQLTSVADLNGYTTTLTYNISNQLTTVTAYAQVPNAAGRSLTFSYGANGLVSSVTDSAGRSLSYTYNAAKELTAVSEVGPIQLAPTYAYTIAGTSALGTAGDGGPATSAQFNNPVGSAVDSSGNVYVADMANNRIQEIAGVTHAQWGIAMTAGDVYTIAGSASGTSGSSGNGGVATSALLNGPNDVALDSAGNLYIGDSVNNRVQFVAQAVCSSSCPWGLAATTANAIYTIAGSATGTAGNSGNGGLATSALLNAPRGLTFDAAGNLYIADKANNRIQFVAKTTCSSSCPWGLASTTANFVYTIAGSASGTAGNSGNGGAATSALLNNPK